MEGYKELLDKLNGLVDSLEKGDLSMDQLNELEVVTRALHERSIILRYKAFESSVLGDTAQEASEESVADPEPEVVIEPAPVEPEVEFQEEVEQEEPTFDFAIFDQEEETSEEEEIEIVVEAEPEIEPIEPEPIVEVEVEEEPVIEEEAPVEVEPEKEEPAPAPAPEPVASRPVGNSFLDRFAQQDNSLAGRFSARPLDSLIGAFGLNERLRFINDLFDGSSEKFSDAIKALDSQSDLDAAKAKVAGYAEENKWDPEEEIVAEFMNYLNRRYA